MELGINAGLQFFSSLAVAWCGMRYYKVGPPTSYKWSYNPYKWPYKWVIGVISPRNKWSYFTLLSLLITGGGGPPTLYSLEAEGISCSLRFPIFPPSHATWRISHLIICMILWQKNPAFTKVPNKIPTCGKRLTFSRMLTANTAKNTRDLYLTQATRSSDCQQGNHVAWKTN